ncbi:MAG TPA: hypothetical protein VHZ24_16175 [Pirellulales bacterium]|jgi:hypothetical protein|nr:hypothetical protein [Pirellulales bacterium]
MTGLEIIIRLDNDRRLYYPGERLTGEFHIESLSLVEPQAIELSALWYTEGQGDEDLAVHHFERFAKDNGSLADARRPRRFSTTLPNSPLSYDGILVRIFWCARVRVFLAGGKEMVAEEPFRLGDVPRVMVATAEEETAP